MSFIDSYEHQLVEAARRRADARPRRRIARWLAAIGRRRGAAAALAALVIAVPATAATVGWNPFDDQGRNPRVSQPSLSSRPVAAELRDALGVLRRPQTDADRGLATSRTLRDTVDASFRGVALDGIRLVDRERGIVLVPVEETPVPRDAQGRPVPGFEDPPPAVCTVERTRDGFAAAGCHSIDEIRSGRTLGSGSGRVTGVVPDGVARVRLVRGDESGEAAVRENFFATEDAPTNPRFVEWLASDGATIRRIDLDAPPPGP